MAYHVNNAALGDTKAPLSRMSVVGWRKQEKLYGGPRIHHAEGENDMKTVKGCVVVDHGFDAEQYFQGCGASFTEFDECATGIGDTAREAFDDALESLAQNDWDVTGIPNRGRGFSRLTVRGYLKGLGFSKSDIEAGDGSETYAYVSIRVK